MYYMYLETTDVLWYKLSNMTHVNDYHILQMSNRGSCRTRVTGRRNARKPSAAGYREQEEEARRNEENGENVGQG